MATPNSKTISVKLLVDKRSQKVVFAEAGKDFVDFLFAILSFPVGTVVRLLFDSENGMVGSLGKLYESFENLNDMYVQPNLNRGILLEPKVPAGIPNNLGLLINVETPKVIYQCSRRGYSDQHTFVSEEPNVKCPACSTTLTRTTYVSPPGTIITEGLVNGVVMYIIKDDLEVKPNSTIATILQLERLNVKCMCDLEEKVVDVGMDEGVRLLKESLQSKSVLTNVFLRDAA